MIERSKTSFRPVNQKRDVSVGKCRPSSTCGSSSNKEKMDMQTSRKPCVAGSLRGDAAARNFDHQLKMKLMDLTPRNRAKETSEGVQEFIKHVSDIIEKKNPFKETAVCSWPKGIKKNAGSPVIDSIQFNGVSKNPQGKEKEEDLESETNCEVDVDEINKKLMRKLKYRGKLNSVPVLKKDSANTKGKINRPKSSMKKREQKDKKYGKDTSALPLRVESKPIKCAAAGKEGEDVTFPKKPPLTQEGLARSPLQNQNRRGRPSEIPLRKDRRDLTRKPKPLTMKQLKEVERRGPVGMQSQSTRSFSPVGKDDGCSELQMTINVDLSSEKISIIGEEIEPSTRLLREKTSGNIKPDRYLESPRTSTFPSRELLEEDSTAGKKSNVIDLEKVKTSSFTVLSNSNTLNRLESLHQKNVQAKDKSTTGKGSSQMALTPKPSFNTLKGKSSKKNLVSRLSSKGNKPGLKLKIKKAKKEANPQPGILRKRSKLTTESPRFAREKISTNGKVGSCVSGGRKNENLSKECFKVHKSSRDDSQSQKVQSDRGHSTTRKTATLRDTEEADATLAKQQEIETVASGVDSENQKLERPKSVRNSLLSKIMNEQSIILNNSTEKKIGRVLYLDSVTEVPMTPPPTPDNTNGFDFGGMEQDGEAEEDQWSSTTVTFNEKFNNENHKWRTIESEMSSKVIAEITEQSSKGEVEAANELLVVKGTSLNIGKDQPPEGVDSPTVKKRLKIDLRAHGAIGKIIERNVESDPGIDMLNEENSRDGSTPIKSSSSCTENGESAERKSQESMNGYSDLFSPDINEPGPLSVVLQKSCSSLKWKSHSRSGGSVKGARKKKIRSDAGDRPSSSASVVFNSDISLQNKNKLDAKVRSGLTKSFKREEKSDVFDDQAALKLKRRNSEPYSFRGYVWKCADAATPKDHKASVSSLTSSMRHLNTDEIDDFIFWEAVPQKMTSCWEMSLYHFKRPWSVLSCSVFRDNRESSTPGLILENLRNGGTLSARRYAANQNERASCRKENPFDVEPSIAQKNIDIRNWLAALNFPTLPSTSNDAFNNEGNFPTPTTIDTQNLNKTQASPKRRKVVTSFKFTDEASKKNSEDKHRKSTKWCNEEGLTDLVRRKSGGFVTCEQYLNSEQSTHRQNVTVNFCVYSKSAEESILVETSDRATVCEPRKYKSVEITSQPELSISATIINSGAVVGDQLIEKTKPKEKPSQEMPIQDGDNVNCSASNSLGNINMLRSEAALFRPDINIWKYLFLITVFIITFHYFYISSYVCRN